LIALEAAGAEVLEVLRVAKARLASGDLTEVDCDDVDIVVAEQMRLLVQHCRGERDEAGIVGLRQAIVGLLARWERGGR